MVNRDEWDQRYAAVDDFLWSAAPNRVLAAEIGDLDPGRAFDLACGEGRNAVWLAEQGWDVVGVDFSEVALGRGRALARRRRVRVEWVLGDVLEFSPEPAGFDLVVVLYLHLPTPFRRVVLARASSGLRPGGTLLVLGHDVTNPERGYGGPSDPSILYSPDDLAADLPELTIVKAEHVYRDVETDAERHVAIDALLRAIRPN